MGQRLDAYDRFPSGMKEYISQYGWHFSKKMCEWAFHGRFIAEGTFDGREGSRSRGRFHGGFSRGK